jgi:hypothetical protein
MKKLKSFTEVSVNSVDDISFYLLTIDDRLIVGKFIDKFHFRTEISPLKQTIFHNVMYDVRQIDPERYRLYKIEI